MLNKLKIGTKLIGGFFMVLFLLGVVAAFGLWGLTESSKSAAEVTSITGIRYDIMKICGLTQDARLAAVNGVLYRTEKYRADRAKIDGDIKTLNINVQKIIDEKKLEDVKSALDNMIASYDAFAAKDEQWYEIEKERVAEVSELVKKADFIVQKLGELTNAIVAAMQSDAEAKLIDGHRYSPDGRVDQLLEAQYCTSSMQKLRRLFYQYLSLTDAVAKNKVKEMIDSTIKELREGYEKVAVKLTTVEGKETSRQIFEAVDVWQKLFYSGIKFLEQQDELDRKQSVDIATLDEKRKEVEEITSKKITDIREVANTVDRRVLTGISAVTLIALFLGVIISLVLSRNITVGLKSAMSSINQVVLDGDLSAEIADVIIHRQDEVGDMARVAGAVLSDYRAVDAMANSLASGDWRITVKEKSPLDTMNQNLDKMLGQVNQVLSEISESVKQVSTGSGEVSSAAQTLSSGAQESSASLEEITASMSEISSQTRANAQSAGEARDLAQKATEAAAEGQDAMKHMNESMEQITKNSAEIQRVIKVIDDIAFQTNLLALNAAVEAARAGAHGKGFAVVAEEVRNLAARSAKAAQETSELISTSGREIVKGGDVASKTSEVLDAIVTQIKQTAELVGGIAVASNEQAQGVAQVTIGLQQIDAVTQQNTAAAEESASAASEMSSMAAKLQELVGKFKLRE
jgi:methyl-accepting chemotaxis protein